MGGKSGVWRRRDMIESWNAISRLDDRTRMRFQTCLSGRPARAQPESRDPGWSPGDESKRGKEWGR